MTAKELIDTIAREFAMDEEVTFLYTDDQGDVRSTDVRVEMNTQTHYEGHYEARIRGTDTWEKVADTGAEYTALRRTDEYQRKYFEHRWVNHNTTVTDTVKVIAIY